MTPALSSRKLLVVIAGAAVMVAVALAFYSISFGSMEEQARIHEQSPDVMVYTENEEYSLQKGKSISILIIEIQVKGRQADAKVAVFDVNMEAREFVETGEKALPAGCTGSLDERDIHPCKRFR